MAARRTAFVSRRPLLTPCKPPQEPSPVAPRVREIVAERSSWTGSATDLLRAGAGRSIDGTPRDCTGWPKNPRALAGRLRRAQTFLRVLGIDIAFSREGSGGSRIIRICATRA